MVLHHLYMYVQCFCLQRNEEVPGGVSSCHFGVGAVDTVEKMGLIWETYVGLSVLGNFSLWLMVGKVTMGPFW